MLMKMIIFGGAQNIKSKFKFHSNYIKFKYKNCKIKIRKKKTNNSNHKV